MPLKDQHCAPQVKGTPAMSPVEVREFLDQTQGWQTDVEFGTISREFRFRNYYETMAFVNALAWIAHREDHHPDLEVRYNRCTVRFHTHSVGGLSRNDFICAARINALLD